MLRSLSFTTFWCFTVYHLHRTFLLLVMYLHTLFIAESYNKLSLFFFLFHIVSPSPRVHSCPISLFNFLHTQNFFPNFINLFSVDANTLNILSTLSSWKKNLPDASEFWFELAVQQTSYSAIRLKFSFSSTRGFSVPLFHGRSTICNILRLSLCFCVLSWWTFHSSLRKDEWRPSTS